MSAANSRLAAERARALLQGNETRQAPDVTAMAAVWATLAVAEAIDRQTVLLASRAAEGIELRGEPADFVTYQDPGRTITVPGTGPCACLGHAHIGAERSGCLLAGCACAGVPRG